MNQYTQRLPVVTIALYCWYMLCKGC